MKGESMVIQKIKQGKNSRPVKLFLQTHMPFVADGDESVPIGTFVEFLEQLPDGTVRVLYNGIVCQVNLDNFE